MYINNLTLFGSNYYNYYITASSYIYSGIILQIPIIPIFDINKIYDATQFLNINSYSLYINMLFDLIIDD